MRFKVSGVDAAGRDRIIIVTAKDESGALAKAKYNGIFPDRVTVAAEGDKDSWSEKPQESKPRENEPAYEMATEPKEFKGPYIYKMFQIPPTLGVNPGESTQQIAALYLEKIVNRFAAHGWEFYRVDSLGIEVAPGCLAALFGANTSRLSYYVITFRKESHGAMPII
jgi:hypothetical protein